LVAVVRSGIKFDADTKTDVQKTVLCLDLTFDKIQNGGGRHFEIQFIGYNSVATACICTIFGTQTKNNVPVTILPSEFTFEQSKMAATAILNFCLMATTRSLIRYCMHRHKI